jgi:putative ABC transport system permease protein
VTAALAAAAVFVAIHAALVVLAVRRRFIARLAVREVVRRGRRSVLVVVGLAIGSAGIAAALIAGDAVDESALVNAYRSWGGTDIVVTAADGAPFPAAVAEELRAAPEVAATVDGVQGGFELVAPVASPAHRRADNDVRIIGFDPAAQERFGAYVLDDGTRTHGEDLPAGHVLVTERLASSLEVGAGDPVSLVLPTGTHDVTVGGVVRAEDAGAYGLRPAVHAPLDALAPLTADQVNVVRVSAVGDVRGGVDASPAARAAVEDALTGITPAVAGSPLALEVREVKAADVESATAGTAWFRAMLGGLSVMLVAAGLTLVVNVALMLAEERRSRLGILRAIGLRRRDLVHLAVLEGAVYSVAATVVGAGAGTAMGALLARQFVVALTQVTGGVVDLSLTVPLRPSTLVLAFCLGAIVTLATVWLAARRTARMTVTAAIRDLPEPAHVRAPSRRRTAVVVTLGALGGGGIVAGMLAGEAMPRLIGGAVLIAAIAALTRRRLPVRPHATATGAALTAWAIASVFSYTDMSDPDAFMALFTLGTMIAVFGLAILAAANLHLVESLAALFGGRTGRLRATLRMPLAELSRRPLRTGLTTGAFGLVLAILTLFAMMFGTLQIETERDAAGFDVIATAAGGATITLPEELAHDVTRDARIRTSSYLGSVRSTFYAGEALQFPLYEVTPELAADPPSGLQSREAAFASDLEVWAALVDDPSAVIGQLGLAGDPATFAARGGPLDARLAGVPLGPFLGIFAGPEAFAELASAAVGETLLLDLRAGVDPGAFAEALESELFGIGVDASPTAEVLELLNTANRNFFASSELLMRMGLVVGVLTLGILALRAVVERRRSIGVSRAIGLRRRQILGGMLAESFVTVTIGVIVGLAAGLTLASNLLTQVYPSLPLGLDGRLLAGVLGLVYGAVLAVTVVPAWQASRLQPVEAMRVTH